ncbi:MAG: hypothetical protein RLZZ330_870 [Actinomycetota bacterium]|jgi:para-aminobenzoate synthetase component 1
MSVQPNSGSRAIAYAWQVPNSFAYLNGQLATEISQITTDLRLVDQGGRWLILGFFNGPTLAIEFLEWDAAAVPTGKWQGSGNWNSNLSSAEYQELVRRAQSEIAKGSFYQVNVCHQFSAKWNPENSISGLFNLLFQKHPSRFATLVNITDQRLKEFGFDEIQIASASPELYLEIGGDVISSSPIKGTCAKGEDFLEKDISENIMIVDLVRNDLSKVCMTASVEVTELLSRLELPNLDHLVSTVSGNLNPGTSWSEIFEATFPPGSVTGAPKSSALKFIKENEPDRNIYCGAIGWIDASEKQAEIAVGIRTFWKASDELKFGAGAGITWDSNPEQEWRETELKAEKLISIASENTEHGNVEHGNVKEIL